MLDERERGLAMGAYSWCRLLARSQFFAAELAKTWQQGGHARSGSLEPPTLRRAAHSDNVLVRASFDDSDRVVDDGRVEHDRRVLELEGQMRTVNAALTRLLSSPNHCNLDEARRQVNILVSPCCYGCIVHKFCICVFGLVTSTFFRGFFAHQLAGRTDGSDLVLLYRGKSMHRDALTVLLSQVQSSYAPVSSTADDGSVDTPRKGKAVPQQETRLAAVRNIITYLSHLGTHSAILLLSCLLYRIFTCFSL